MKRIDNIEKNFIPQDREDKIYNMWQVRGCFTADPQSGKKPYTIVMPPPNITGVLHMGHALDLTLQDTLIRFKRMQGYEVLWLPGTDHASIATEMKIVEAMRKENLTKDDLGREKFLIRAWNWKERYGNQIVEQIKRMGSSCDWSRLRFTMDEGLSKAVEYVFINLYKKGLIYRGNRMINWCPVCMTSISDAEVEHLDRQDQFWHLRYPLTDGSGHLEVATTRPETMLGDTAVAVNPSDGRYQNLVGKTVILPLVNREIPIIADEYVDPEFGTGVVKITPAHDPNDFEVGLRHNLEVIDVLNDDATINELGGKYQGLTREDARTKIVEDLTKEGFLVKTENIDHAVGTCYRCNTVIEPKLSEQWFVAMEELAKPAIEAVRSGEINFIPERFNKTYFHWMENIRDWNISRQLWWGHRIPAWYCEECGEITVPQQPGQIPDCCDSCQCTHLRQDEDTLDTWFSSALWPFSTLGWPEQTEDLDFFYPTDVLVTGYDIITFWVSRMIFSGIEHTGKIPFHDVLIHGIVRDELGRKMSKSLGNGIDPLEVIDQYGADALRFALVAGVAAGNDLRYQTERIENGRNFINKFWNAFRFVMLNIENEISFNDLDLDYNDTELAIEDKWILSNLQDLIKEVSYNMEQYDLGIALTKIYNFLWDNFCDWYIEMVKARLQGEDQLSKLTAQSVLNHVLCQCMALLHPYMPFVTEDIYRSLLHKDGLLIKQAWPTVDEKLIFPEEAAQMELLIEVIHGVRNIRAEMSVPHNRKSGLMVVSESAVVRSTFENAAQSLENLAGINQVTIHTDNSDIPETAITLPFSAGTAYLPLEDLIDPEEEKKRLANELAKYQAEIKRAENKLSNKNFTDKAPEQVVAKERQKLEDYRNMYQQTEIRLKSFQTDG
ncbi:MAG TPA: valine--tRNA ligase [Clostridiaceae bacterium]|nr:valine--tRNA ligase [Clostridiaceae bacterium]